MKNIFISKELITHLRTLFPDVLPSPKGLTTNALALEVNFLQGQQTVIAKLEQMLEDDQPDEI
jgi:hypothetical protein